MSLVASASATVACTVLMVQRARSCPRERDVWLRWAACAPAVAVAIGLDQLGVPLAPSIVVVAVFPLAYGAAVRWNRYATSMADPHEVINGIASALALAAVLDVVAQLWRLGLYDLPWQDRAVLWGPIACALIIATTVLTIIPASGLGRDPRAWLMLVALVLVVVLAAGELLGLSTTGASAVFAVSALAAGLAAHRPPGTEPARPVDATASTVGGFVILVASLGTMLTASVGGVAGPSTWLAAVAGCLSAVRLLRNLQDIAALTVSRHEALTDDLTGVPNRRALLRRAQGLLDGGQPLVLAIVDLDDFKRINDGLGHAAGDQLLRQMAHRLQSVCREGELLGRLGGDEFAFVAPLRRADQAAAHTDRLAQALLAALSPPVDIAGFLVHGSGSIGLTSTTPEAAAVDLSEVLRQADAAMYEAKATRGIAVTYDSARHGAHGQLMLLEELRAGLLDGGLVLHHQPQIDIRTGRLVGVEALVRWEHPTRGLLPPAAFLGLAEAQGLMGRLTERVLEQAVSQLAQWRAAGLSVRMSVNLSASNLLDIRLPDRVRALLDQHGVRAGDLTLEVTETVLVQDSESATRTLQSLSEAGVDLSIDDFGTGWSSLAYLRRLPAQELKLDASFTRDLLTDGKTAAIVASTITLAHQLGLRVVAEGVEDETTLQRLGTLGCDVSQGYLHARPLTPAQLLDWAHRHRTASDARHDATTTGLLRTRVSCPEVGDGSAVVAAT